MLLLIVGLVAQAFGCAVWCAAGRSSWPRVELGGVRFDALREKDVVEVVLSSLRAGHGGVIATPNLDHLALVRQGAFELDLLERAQLVVADGMAIVWASRISGDPLPARVAGSALVPAICAASAQESKSIAFVGGRPGAAEEAARRLARQYPTLRVVATVCPPMGFEQTPAGMRALVDKLQDARPDVVFTGLGAPKQERVNAALLCELPATWFVACGGAFEMLAGYVKRAPTWMQDAGLEWVWRLLHEPRRLGRRYLGRDVPFAVRLFAVSLSARRNKPRPERPAARGRRGDTTRDEVSTRVPHCHKE